jgi:predicted nucleic acid-binding protein
MTDRALIDSNVVVYAADPADHEKQRRAVDTLDELVRVGRGVLSTQVLGEFFRVSTERIRQPLSRTEARRRMAGLLESWPVLSITPPIVLEAARGAQDFQLAYWDAQLWATARLNQVGVILTEDFQDGLVLDGVRFLNPFAPSFDLVTLLG